MPDDLSWTLACVGENHDRAASVAPSFVPGKRGFEVLEFGFVAGNEVDADDIEANRRGSGLRELADIAAGEAAEDVALVVVDSGFGGSEIAGGAGFNFNEAEHGSVPRNEVDVAGDIA